MASIVVVAPVLFAGIKNNPALSNTQRHRGLLADDTVVVAVVLPPALVVDASVVGAVAVGDGLGARGEPGPNAAAGGGLADHARRCGR